MNPNQTPGTDPAKEEGWRGFAPVLGCGIGGCILPFLLLLFCLIVFNDAGGPLFWPIIAVPMALVGLLIGISIRARGKAKEE